MASPLLEAITAAYIDPVTGGVQLHPNVSGQDSDNMLLFTATFVLLLQDPAEQAQARVNLLKTALACQLQPGEYCRYPGQTTPTSWDDHLGLSVASEVLAQEIHTYGVQNDWDWGANWLGRIPLFAPTVTASALNRLSYPLSLWAALPFLTDCLQPASSTSGRCLLYLAQRSLVGRHNLLDGVMQRWRTQMGQLYKGGMRDVYSTYFGPAHPFSLYGPEDFAP
jgi:hypothetical protein